MVKFTDRPKFENSIRNLLRDLMQLDANVDREPLLLADYTPQWRTVEEIPLAEIENVEAMLRHELSVKKRFAHIYDAYTTIEAKADLYLAAILKVQADLQAQYFEKDDFVPWLTFHSLWKKAFNGELEGQEQDAKQKEAAHGTEKMQSFEG